MEFLITIAKNENRFCQNKTTDGSIKKIYDIETIAKIMIKNFFDGKLGKICLDTDILFEKPNEELAELNKFV
jgi:hypothetical protein